MSLPSAAQAAPGREPSSSDATPIGRSERVDSLDIIRALAFFAVLTIHASIFASVGGSETPARTPLEAGLERLSDIFIRGKGISTFSMLFGVGFLIQFERAAARGHSLVPFALRRLGVLFVLGALHYQFVWTGDVLLLYAVLGFAILPFLSVRPATFLVLAGTVFLLLSCVPNFAQAFGLDPRWSVETWHHPAIRALGNKPLEGLFGTEVPVRLGRTIARMLHEAGAILPLFYLGAALWRKGLFSHPSDHRALLRRVTWICLPLGLALSILVNLPNAWVSHEVTMRGYGTLWSLIEDGGTFALALGYITGLLQLLLRPAWTGRLVAWLAPLGRMALTNYLTHTVLLILFFRLCRLAGLPMTISTSLLVALAAFALQLAWSRAWLGWFRFGPLEWGWRCITYLRLEPFRLAEGRGTRRVRTPVA